MCLGGVMGVYNEFWLGCHLEAFSMVQSHGVTGFGDPCSLTIPSRCKIPRKRGWCDDRDGA